MADLRVGFIGTGDPRAKRSVMGYAMAYRQAPGYVDLADKCKIVACADLVRERAEIFSETFDVPGVYTDYHEMLEKENLDMVSICTWMHLHEQMTVDCAEAGVRAVHCEKPMATTWAGCKRMAKVCADKGVQLTFNHMRRFGKPFREAKALLDAGEIGQLRTLQYGEANLYDGGTHHLDMFGFFNDQTPVEWAMAQIDYRTESLVFGSHNENVAYAVWKYQNGVYGQCLTGRAGRELIGAYDKLVGTEGAIEVGPFLPKGEERVMLRIMRKGSTKWENVDCGPEGLHGHNDDAKEPVLYHRRAVACAVQCLEEGTEPEIGAKNALQSTEITFACWESARRRGIVEFPLDIEDNPLDAMVASGDLKPAKRE
ncbi:MAG: Gfo/Idh/MocA family oxidoreductase [Candidatus Brocadiae bacterium]|nr:Gfo/Idh/MocA family oxidoreductase [Candidatus Brocadiia bacterium]